MLILPYLYSSPSSTVNIILKPSFSLSNWATAGLISTSAYPEKKSGILSMKLLGDVREINPMNGFKKKGERIKQKKRKNSKM